MIVSKPRPKQQEVRRFLSRLTSPRTVHAAHEPERRAEPRSDLSIGVWVIPFSDGGPEIGRAFLAVTKDVSPTGLSIITDRPPAAPEVLVCFLGQSESAFLRAVIRNHRNLGLGWTRLGMEVLERVASAEYPQVSAFFQSALSGDA